MYRRHRLGLAAVGVFFILSPVAMRAQTGELRGSVFLQRADGAKIPLAGAQIDVFRTDMKASFTAKTDANGAFRFVGLPFVGTYTVEASHPTGAPKWVSGVKAGRNIPVDIILAPGDGKRQSLDEIMSGAGASNPNRNVQDANDIVARTFKAGNEAIEEA